MKRPITLAAPVVPLNVSVGEMHLSGYSKRDGARFASAFQQELGRLLQAQPQPAAGYRQDQLMLPRFYTQAQERPEQTGRRLARAIARALRP
ncbi:MAG: hypothetical protein FCKEOINB_00983 [Nitrosomonas sp.]|nr:hypothetical protein [Nitrosomonas sp.]